MREVDTLSLSRVTSRHRRSRLQLSESLFNLRSCDSSQEEKLSAPGDHGDVIITGSLLQSCPDFLVYVEVGIMECGGGSGDGGRRQGVSTAAVQQCWDQRRRLAALRDAATGGRRHSMILLKLIRSAKGEKGREEGCGGCLRV